MPKGASPKREREYLQLEHQFEREGRYPGREQEVAARIVNKQRPEAGETRQDQQLARQAPRRLSTTRRSTPF
jgi:signal recognition particle subunit SEC65